MRGTAKGEPTLIVVRKLFEEIVFAHCRSWRMSHIIIGQKFLYYCSSVKCQNLNELYLSLNKLGAKRNSNSLFKS